MFTFIPEAQYYHAKQACYLCANPKDLVDTSVPIEGEGVLAICTRCLQTMFDTAGLDATADEEIETLTRRYTEVAEKLLDEQKFSKKLRTELRELKRPPKAPTFPGDGPNPVAKLLDPDPASAVGTLI